MLLLFSKIIHWVAGMMAQCRSCTSLPLLWLGQQARRRGRWWWLSTSLAGCLSCLWGGILPSSLTGFPPIQTSILMGTYRGTLKSVKTRLNCLHTRWGDWVQCFLSGWGEGAWGGQSIFVDNCFWKIQHTNYFYVIQNKLILWYQKFSIRSTYVCLCAYSDNKFINTLLSIIHLCEP